MSRKKKGPPGRQKATNAPPAEPKPRACDDVLTLLAESMRPAHRRFAEGILAGQLGAKAATAAGFSEASARGTAYKLLRREDVRRYIRLAQREQAVAARVNLSAIVDRLWRTITDSNAPAKRQEVALNLLVRIALAARGKGGADVDADENDGAGLTDEKVAVIEARILGVRRRT